MSIATEPTDATAAQTKWEGLHDSRWGKYISDVEWRAIQTGSDLAGPPTSAIEIGVDGGRWSKMLADLGWQMTCTDVNPDTLEVCQQRIPSANCILVDPEDHEIPAETASHRLVLCIEVPGVVESDWFIEEAYRVLQPGGAIVGVFQNSRSLRGVIKNAMKREVNPELYYSKAYPPWRRQLLQRGFQPIGEEGICWFPYGRASNSRLIPTATAFERRLGLRRLTGLSPWIVLVAQKPA